ncbi:MAG: hypothetical protein AMJ58_03045 [Gammaproteobacteria bacterium SG8_30]|jgi:uncharacterized membrane protein|nr:MAG: hypothetical protein AMJ58_03045 [Gammaproteobacteria bacterium SG8_30]
MSLPGTRPGDWRGAVESLFHNPEGRLLLLGLSLFALMLLCFGIGWTLFPDETLVLAGMAGLNLLIGRAAGMSFGYAAGLGHDVVIPANMIVESIQVIVVYPLFVLSWTHLIDSKRWNATMSTMRSAAEARRGTIQRFGLLGLVVFVFTPFWMTGPVVGSIIGYLIGLRMRTNLLAVLFSTYVAIGVWALLLNELSEWAAAYNRYAPYALVAAFALIALAGRFMHARPGRRGPRT